MGRGGKSGSSSYPRSRGGSSLLLVPFYVLIPLAVVFNKTKFLELMQKFDGISRIMLYIFVLFVVFKITLTLIYSIFSKYKKQNNS
jgi:hypothetical protein